MAFENLSKEQFEELRRKAREQSFSTPNQAGAAANAQQEDRNAFDPLKSAVNFVGDVAQGAAGAAQFGAGMFGNAANQIGAAAGGAVEGAGDFFNEQGKRIQAIGDVAQGNAAGAMEKMKGAEQDAVRAKTKLMGAAGNIAGAGGSALLGAASVLAAPVVAPAYATGRYAGDLGNVVAPDQARAVQEGAAGAAQGAAGFVQGATDAVRGVAKANYANMRNPLTGENMGFDDAEAQKLGDAALTSTQALPVPAGMVAAKAGNLAKKFGGEALEQITGRMTKEAADLVATPKSVGGSWLSAMGDQLKQGATKIAMKMDGVDLPENMSMKQVSDNYFKSRADAFYGSNVGKIVGAAQSVAKPIMPMAKTVAGAAYDLTPLSYGTKLTKAAIGAEVKLGKYAYNTVQKFLGTDAADMVAAATVPSPELVKKYGLDAKDQTSVMQRVKAAFDAGLNTETIGRVVDAVSPTFQKVKEAVAKGVDNLKGVADTIDIHNANIGEAAAGVVREGLGTTSAFYENTRQAFASVINEIGGSPLASSLKKELGDMATQVTKNQTVEALQKTLSRVDEMLSGKNITPEELAQNRGFLGKLKNSVTEDLAQTMSYMSPSLKAMFDESKKLVDDLSASTVNRIKSLVDKAPSEAAKRKVFKDNVVKELSAIGADKISPVMDRLATYADTWFEDGAVAMHDALKGTPFEKLAEWKALRNMMPDETEDMLKIDELYQKRDKGPAFKWVADAANYVRSKMSNEDALAQRLLASKSDDAFESYALKENLQPQQVKSLISGDKSEIDLKIGMLENAEKTMGRTAAEYIPSDLIGAQVAGEYKALKALQSTVGKEYEDALKTMANESVEVTEPVNNLMMKLQKALDLEVDADGNLVPSEISNLNAAATDRNKLKSILTLVNKRLKIDDNGLFSMKVEDLDKLEQLFDEIPGQFGLSDTGGTRKVIENIFGTFRKDVQASLPENVRDLQAYYAKVMDAQRAFYKLAGLNEKNFNSRTIWRPDPEAGGLPRDLTETAARQVGQNLKKLTGASRAEYHDLLEQIYSITRENKDVGPLMAKTYRLLEANRFIRETVGEPISTMAGNEGAFRGDAGITDSKWGGVASSFKNQGPARAAAGILLMETKPEEKFRAVLNLLKNQRRLIDEFGEKAVYTIDNPFGPDTLGMASTTEAVKRYKTPEDTAQASPYDSDIGMKGMVLDEPSQTLPDDAAQNVPFEGQASPMATGMPNEEEQLPF